MARKKTLEAQLAALMVEHDLTAFSLSIHRMENGRIFQNCNAHAKGKKHGPTLCESSGNDHPTFNDAVGSAIAKLKAARGDYDLDVEIAPMQESAVVIDAGN